MEIILRVKEKEMCFSEKELVQIVEGFFDEETKWSSILPIEGHWFEVKPKRINRQLFEKERLDPKQEKVRKLILEAFEEVDANPRKTRNFKTLMPEKKWEEITFKELKVIAQKMGDHMADWVEQSLEWAQRIQNGEKWKAVCNYSETADWYRAITWKNQKFKIIGGSINSKCYDSPSDIAIYDYSPEEKVTNTVPLVVMFAK